MLSYTAPRATVQQVLQNYPLSCNENLHVAKVLQRIKTCRTSALGYHVYRCSDKACNHISINTTVAETGIALIAVL